MAGQTETMMNDRSPCHDETPAPACRAAGDRAVLQLRVSPGLMPPGLGPDDAQTWRGARFGCPRGAGVPTIAALRRGGVPWAHGRVGAGRETEAFARAVENAGVRTAPPDAPRDPGPGGGYRDSGTGSPEVLLGQRCRRAGRGR